MKRSDWLLIATTQHDARKIIRTGAAVSLACASLQAWLGFTTQGPTTLIEASFFVIPALLVWMSKSIWPAILLFFVSGMALGSSFYGQVMGLNGITHVLISTALVATSFQLYQAAYLLRRPLTPPPAPGRSSQESIAS